MIHICDVCKYVDGDETRKECSYCPTCKAFICSADERRADRRAIALIKKRLSNGK